MKVLVFLALLLGCRHSVEPVDPDPGSMVSNASVLGAREPSSARAPTAESPILVDSPEAGATVSGTVEISGRVRVFEGQVALRVVQGPKELVTGSAVASASAPEVGVFSKRLELPAGASGSASVEVFTRSAATGAVEHLVRVPVVVK